jgi:uncharacterized protein YoxC
MADSFFEKNKTLVIAGGGGAALALLYLVSRGSGSGITVSGEAAATSQLQSFWDAIQDALSAQSEALTESTAEAVAAASEELRAERGGLLETLSDALNASIDTLTNQLNALVGRTAALETETASLAAEVESKTAELQTALQAQSSAFASQISGLQSSLSSQLSDVVKKPQAELMAEDTRYQAAIAAMLGQFSSDIGYWADRERRARGIMAVQNLFGLSGTKAAAYRSHAESVYQQLQRGEFGSAGTFLGPVETGPMGSTIVDRPGALSFGRSYAPDVALPVFGVKVSQ